MTEKEGEMHRCSLSSLTPMEIFPTSVEFSNSADKFDATASLRSFLAHEFATIAATHARIEEQLFALREHERSTPGCGGAVPLWVSKPPEPKAVPFAAAGVEMRAERGGLGPCPLRVLPALRADDGCSLDGMEDEEYNLDDEAIPASSELPASWPTKLEAREVARDMSSGKTRGSGSKNVDLESVTRRSEQSMAASMDSREEIQGPDSRFVVHPNSVAHMVYNLISFVVLMYDLTVMPFVLAWDTVIPGWMEVMFWVTPCFWLFDIGMNFNTGVYSHGNLYMNHRQIAWRYLTTTFILDFTIVVCDMTGAIMGASSQDSTPSGTLKVARFTKVGRLLRIAGMFRMLRLVRIIEDFAETYLTEGYTLAFKIASIFLMIMWGTHLLACMWFAVGRWEVDTEVSWLDYSVLQREGEDLHFLDMSIAYQYTTAVHWSAAQIALGGVDVYPKNSAERAFNVLAMMLGFLLGSMMVSSLSAAMVDFQAQRQDKTQKLRSLRRYLGENAVEPNFAIRVQKMAQEQLTHRDPLKEKDVPVILVLSNTLQQRLRVEVQRPHLSKNPLFRLFLSEDINTMTAIATEVINPLNLRPNDELFAPGFNCNTAYCLTRGSLTYTQTPESAPVERTVVVKVPEGRWLCEAALWSHWICVGGAEALTACHLLTIDAEGLNHQLQKSVALRDIRAEYMKHFHRRIVTARPPENNYPTDLEVPDTDYCELVVSMSKEVQVTIGVEALWIWCQSHHHSRKAVARLESEVQSGKSIVLVTGKGQVLRVVSIVALHVEREDGAVFAQLGKIESNVTKAACQLPGTKQDRGEIVHDTVQRMLRKKWNILADKTEMLHMVKEVQEKESAEYGVQSRYLRNIVWEKMRDGSRIDAPVCKLRPRSEEGEMVAPQGSSELMHDASSFWDSCLQKSIYMVREGTDGNDAVLYAWLQQEEFNLLTTKVGQGVLKAWLALIDLDDPVAEAASAGAASEASVEGDFRV